MPKNDQIWPKIGIFGQFGPGHAFGALLVGRLVVVARGLYLARHLFTLSNFFIKFHLQLTQSDCLEAFQDPSIGGIALALPHGSVVIECAKVPDPF